MDNNSMLPAGGTYPQSKGSSDGPVSSDTRAPAGQSDTHRQGRQRNKLIPEKARSGQAHQSVHDDGKAQPGDFDSRRISIDEQYGYFTDSSFSRGLPDREKSRRRSRSPEGDRYGLVYTSARNLEEVARWVKDCHIAVVSSATLLPSDNLAGPLADSLITDEEAAIQPMPHKLRILNTLLLDEISLHIWPGARLGLKYNPNQAAPFLDLIPSERALRKRHLELEADFRQIAQENPLHPAVTRQRTVFPRSDQTDFGPHGRRVLDMDKVEKLRALVDGFRALIRLLDTSLSGLVDSYRRIEDGTVETLPLSHLWFLFHPGQEIVLNSHIYQAYRVLHLTGGGDLLEENSPNGIGSSLIIECFYIDFDGYSFGPVRMSIKLSPYEGIKSIHKLEVCPLALHNLTTVSRRREISDYRRGSPSHLQIDSEVIIDFELAFRQIDRPVFGDGLIAKLTKEDLSRPATIWGNLEYHKVQRLQWLQSTNLLSRCSPAALSNDAARLLPGRVYGYVLLNRKWSPLNLDLLEAIPAIKPGEKDGFETLVLPRGHGDIVRALVQTHVRKVDAEGYSSNRERPQRGFDVVKGKGNGLVILLHGAPGVGKTSTAECVASHTGRPLFPITCGDLGAETAQEVEANFGKFFSLARRWNCVLLLDEADVFLSARVEGNIRHNSLVSVFLRVLEYYSGILVLTTNRVGSFDEAIKSRVHCALYYPPLDKDQTFRVWEMNIDALEARNRALESHQRVEFNRREIEAYARDHWRAGKRANRWNAVALAEWDAALYTDCEGSPSRILLRREHFEKVAEASRHFDHYLETVRRADHVRAKEVDLRDDNIRTSYSEGDEGGDLRRKQKKKKNKGRTKKSISRRERGSSDNKSKSKKSRWRSETGSEDSSSTESSSDNSSSQSESSLGAEEEPSPSPRPEASQKKKVERTPTKRAKEERKDQWC
ncbi:hypothetical protein F5Y17DRAFT_477338 [Xylariaceae sp. FL0594]|nr:hypothetical protein F5Y17DRAFT_477338 [Xylariaceae sp. FL0594]